MTIHDRVKRSIDVTKINNSRIVDGDDSDGAVIEI
jgi:hypothetical protein